MTVTSDIGFRPSGVLEAGEPCEPVSSLRVLFLVSAHNGLSQRALIALSELGHQVVVEVVDGPAAMEAAVAENRPQLIVCPFLKTLIPESIWSEHRCLIVHPGPQGDRGPSALDWAIELEMPDWGVTVLEATGEADAGPVWATRDFPMRKAGKSSLYRHEVRRGAVAALIETIDRIVAGESAAEVLDPEGRLQILDPDRRPQIGCARPLMTQDDRTINWSSDTTNSVIRKIRAAEGHPGVLDAIHGTEFHLFGAHRERTLCGRPGEVIAHRTGAICRATIDGAVWITHLKRRDTPTERYFKLPATRALALAGQTLRVPEIDVPLDVGLDTRPHVNDTYREIAYEEDAGVAYLHFDFYNGAMSTEQCQRLCDTYRYLRARRQTKVIALVGGGDYFSNGIHLNVIEAAEDPAEESWRNLQAIDDLVREIIETDSHLVISALAGDAAAGGVPLALAADLVVAREDVVLNPCYRHMGGLYGSEYWTYLLPRRVGPVMTERLTNTPFTPVGTRQAVQIGLLDATFGSTLGSFRDQTRELAECLSADAETEHRLEHKRRRRARDQTIKPLAAYRMQELSRSYECFFGPDPSYHQARRRFVYKLGAACSPNPLATAPVGAT